MNDMTSVIIPKSDQINADDLIGGTMTITITDVRIKGGQEQPVSIYFDGSDKAFRPCKSMSRVLVAAWGPDAKKYVGRSLTLYRDPKVKWGGMEVGGIRISHMSHLERPMTMALTMTKGSRAPFVVKPLEQSAGTTPTIADARAWIADADDLAALETVWKSRTMAPFRAELQDDLNARKAKLSISPHHDADEAGATSEKLELAIQQVNRKVRQEDVHSIVNDWMSELDDADQNRLREAGMARIAAIRAGEA